MKGPRHVQKHQEPKIAVNTTARHSKEPVEICSCTTNVPNTLLTHTDASILLSGSLLKPSLAVFLSRLETTPGIATVIEILAIIQNPEFDAHLFSIQIQRKAY